MTMERKTTDQKKNYPLTLAVLIMIIAFVSIQLIVNLNSNPNGTPYQIPENWHVEVTAKTLPIEAQLPVTLQVIVMDGDHNWIKKSRSKG
ncbi:MAG: hypothetical protein LRY73_10320 [Bacillus sp. (in: Bacteria)]|nr:hypothetical protein [Bacillus sp. (in: firmicutes)]